MVDLMICGAMRSGTSSLFNNLKKHPEIASISESQLTVKGCYVGWPFASPVFAHYQLGFERGFYEALASGVRRPHSRIVITKQPYFMVFPHIAFGLREQLPNVKLIFILREQPQMIASAFYTLYRKGRYEDMALVEFLPERVLNGMTSESTGYELPSRRTEWHFEYWNLLGSETPEGAFVLERGFYYEQLKRFFLLFPPSQIMAIKHSEYVADPARILKQICEFAGVDTGFEFPAADTIYSKGPEREEMDSDLHGRIKRFYAESNERLFRLLDWRGF